jgi:hypothetical protein
MSSILKVDTIQDQSGNNIINESGNVITIGASGDTITIPSGATFASVGIDDNATSTAITIDSSGDVGINITSPNLTPFNKAVTLSGTGNCAYELAKGSTLHGAVALQGDDRVQLINFQNADLTFNTGTSATERMRIDHSTGNIGIGTSSPSAKLHVDVSNSGVAPNANADELFVESSGNAGITIGTGTSSAGQLCFGDSGDNDIGAIAYLHDVNAMRFTTNGVEAMRITNAGRMGIGTTSPSENLQVMDTASNKPQIRLETSDGGNKRLDLYVDGSIGTIAADQSSQSLAFRTSNSERMRIHSSGKVSIGTTTADGILKLDNTGQTTQTLLTLEDTGGSGAHTQIELKNTTGAVASILTSSDNLEFRVDDATVFSNISGSEHMRITSAGNILVGSTTNDSTDSNGQTIKGLVLSGNNGNGTYTYLRLLNRVENATTSNGVSIAFDHAVSNTTKIPLSRITASPESSTAGSLKFFTSTSSSLGERMRINSAGAVSIGSSNVTQNSHLNVRQDSNSHATRTYLNANVSSGAFSSIKYLGTIPVVSSGTQLLIPFISQSNINSKTYVHIRGMSCESNTNNPKAFDVKFSIGHISTLGTLTVLQNLGTCTGLSKSGMNVVLSFNTNYQHSGDNGMFIEIDYIAHHQDASINLGGIVMN